MVKDTFTSLKLSPNNLHLKNIFVPDSYLELGNIDYNVIKRILNYEMVNIKDICSYDIFNMGVGHSNLKSEELNNFIPFQFFKSITDKDGLRQLFITYGILKYINIDKREVFMPILLLPIEMVINNMDIYIKLIYRPIENPLIDTTFTDYTKVNIPAIDKFNTIYNMDEFCLSFTKIDQFEVKLENYLTYGNLKKKDLMLDFSKFQQKREFNEAYFQRLFISRVENPYYSEPLSRVQREILMTSLQGKNFSIMGRTGTGKTTVLKDIAINAISNNKRVLYVSDIDATLNDVYNTFCEKKLNNYITNFSKSFPSILDSGIESFSTNYTAINELLDEIDSRYSIIEDYERAMRGRIANFRFTDIIDQLGYLVDQEKNPDLEIGDVSNIYKHEYLEIKESLIKIEEARKKLSSFVGSIWKEIPVINNIKYPNQIITLIYQIDKCFRTFLEEKNYLEENYGVNTIENYAKLKSIIFYLENLDIESIPTSWIEESLSNFREAQREYKNLKNDVYKTQEIEYYITHRYKDLNTIDIDDEIKYILSDYYKQEDCSKINLLNENRKELSTDINRKSLKREIFMSSASKISNLVDWNFIDNDEAISQILKFADFIEKATYSSRWINIIVNNQYQSLLMKLKQKDSEIKQLEQSVYSFEQEFPKISPEEYKALLVDIEEANKIENNKEKNKILSSIRKKNNNLKIDYLVERIKNQINGLKELKKKKDEYYDIIRIKYSKENDVITQFENLKDYILGIEKKEYRNYIVRLLYKAVYKGTTSKDEYDKYVKTIYTFKNSYNDIEKLFDKLNSYGFTISGDNFIEKMDCAEKISVYIYNVFVSNDRVKKIIRDKNTEYVKAETYFEIRDILEEKKKYASILNENEKYPRIYGKLYMASKTDISLIARILQNYSSYYECFSNNKFFISSLSKDRNNILKKHILTCKEVNENLNEVFKLYCKIFKDGISRYYYTDFFETLNYTNVLLSSKDELLTYLAITDGVSVLKKYKLDKVIKYITDDNKLNNLTTTFSYLYMNELKERYLSDNKIITKVDSLNKFLQETIMLENEIIKYDGENVLSDIRKYSSHKLNLTGIGLNYQAYVRRTKGLKHLFLASTKFVNRYLDVKDFDLIIIDDAHILSTNQQFINDSLGQVIVAGEYQMHASISSNLISIMRNTQQYNLEYRYDVMPKNLMDYSLGLRGINYPDYPNNIGLEIIEKGIAQYIFQLFYKDNDVRINYFTKEISKQRILFEVLAKILLSKGYTSLTINHFFDKNINICDLSTGYMIPSDYNIVELEDYEMVDIEYISSNMIDNLLLCRKKLVIYDNKKLLQEERNTRFFMEIKNILDGRLELFNEQFTDKSLEMLSVEIKNYGYEVYSNKGSIDFIIKRDNNLYGVIMLFDDMNSDEIINIYRDNYKVAVKNNWKIITVSKIILLQGIKKTAKYLIEEIENGKR